MDCRRYTLWDLAELINAHSAVYRNGLASEPDEAVCLPKESKVYVCASAPAELDKDMTEPRPSAS
jgi:hypothetical protein